MKLITEQGIQELEKKLSGQVFSDRYCKNIEVYYSSLIDLQETKEMLDNLGVVNKIDKLNYLVFQQSELSKILPNIDNSLTEERVWDGGGNKVIPTKDLSHQRLSNILGLLDLMLTKGKISKEHANKYLSQIIDNIGPEINERFQGVILEYKPYYEWEKKMLKLPDV